MIAITSVFLLTLVYLAIRKYSDASPGEANRVILVLILMGAYFLLFLNLWKKSFILVWSIGLAPLLLTLLFALNPVFDRHIRPELLLEREGLDALVWGDESASPNESGSGGRISSFVYNISVQEREIPANFVAGTHPVGTWRDRTAEGVKAYLSKYADDEKLIISISPDWRRPVEASNIPTGFTEMRAIFGIVSLPDLEVYELFEMPAETHQIRMVRGVQYNPVSNTLFVSHISSDNGCLALEVVEFKLRQEPLRLTEPVTRFKTTPCLDFIRSAHQHGGAMAVLENGSVIVTVGDFGYGLSYLEGQRGLEGWDGESRPEILMPPNSFGSTFIIGDGGVELFSSGHRNQQGVTSDPLTGAIWASEHGPRGGGELNLLRKGLDYGWPDVTYGRPYDRDPIPTGEWEVGAPWAGWHEGFERPIMTWVPSIAPSSLLVYRGETFLGWEGDILLGTLRDQSIRRIRIQDERVLFDERIELGHRVRDMVADQRGALIIATDKPSLLRLTVEDLEN